MERRIDQPRGGYCSGDGEWPREIARAGDLWHAPPGHTAWCNEDSEFIEFSPQHELVTLLDHVRKQVQAASR